MANLKSKIASKMKISPDILLRLARRGGKVGKMVAAFDSWKSRTVDKGKGIYKDL